MSTAFDTAGPTGAAEPPDPATTRRGGRWWRVLGSVFAVVALAAITLQVVSLLARSTEVVRTVHPSSGVDRLEVLDPNGDVRITGTDRTDVLVVATVSHGLQRTTARVELDGGVLRASSSCPWLTGRCWVDYRVEVPRDLAVSVDAGNGTVELGGLDDTVRITSGNGDIAADDLAGAARLRSRNGDVRVTGATSERLEAMSDNGDVAVDLREAPIRAVAESSNGDVELRLPRTEHTYDLELVTDNGERFGQVRTDPDSDRELVVRSRNGDVTVGYRSA